MPRYVCPGCGAALEAKASRRLEASDGINNFAVSTDYACPSCGRLFHLFLVARHPKDEEHWSQVQAGGRLPLDASGAPRPLSQPP
jgi:DNA-directed RNA polymerase subunit RPC12/RpoP